MSKEVSGICSNEIQLIDTLRELDKLGVIEFDNDTNLIKMASVVE